MDNQQKKGTNDNEKKFFSFCSNVRVFGGL